ncbi:hypothetical protein ACVWWI_006252 [Bradyrhizobium sp. USDA 3686]|nr:hypothetical protein [Bradyrhizobium canariense]
MFRSGRSRYAVEKHCVRTTRLSKSFRAVTHGQFAYFKRNLRFELIRQRVDVGLYRLGNPAPRLSAGSVLSSEWQHASAVCPRMLAKQGSAESPQCPRSDSVHCERDSAAQMTEHEGAVALKPCCFRLSTIALPSILPSALHLNQPLGMVVDRTRLAISCRPTSSRSLAKIVRKRCRHLASKATSIDKHS